MERARGTRASLVSAGMQGRDRRGSASASAGGARLGWRRHGRCAVEGGGGRTDDEAAPAYRLVDRRAADQAIRERDHAATLIARNPDVTLKGLMAAIVHASPVAALRCQDTTQERSREIATYPDGVIEAAGRPPAAVLGPLRP